MLLFFTSSEALRDYHGSSKINQCSRKWLITFRIITMIFRTLSSLVNEAVTQNKAGDRLFTSVIYSVYNWTHFG